MRNINILNKKWDISNKTYLYIGWEISIYRVRNIDTSNEKYRYIEWEISKVKCFKVLSKGNVSSEVGRVWSRRNNAFHPLRGIALYNETFLGSRYLGYGRRIEFRPYTYLIHYLYSTVERMVWEKIFCYADNDELFLKLFCKFFIFHSLWIEFFSNYDFFFKFINFIILKICKIYPISHNSFFSHVMCVCVFFFFKYIYAGM